MQCNVDLHEDQLSFWTDLISPGLAAVIHQGDLGEDHKWKGGGGWSKVWKKTPQTVT